MRLDDSKKIIFYFIESIEIDSGGVVYVLKDIIDSIDRSNYQTYIITFNSRGVDLIKKPNIKIIKLEKYNFIYNYLFLKKLLKDFKFYKSIIHIHGFWCYLNIFILIHNLKFNFPTILSPHGMLEDWLIYNQGLFKFLKKKIFLYFFINLYKKINLIHCITNNEQRTINKYLNLKVVIIPHCIKFDNLDLKEEKKFKKKYFLYIGRLNKKKGIENLIKCFSEIKQNTFKLYIVGNGERKYVSELKKIALNNKKIIFLNPMFKSKKYNFMKKAWFGVVPTNSDVITLVNLEFAGCCTPTITTFESGIRNWELSGGFIYNANQYIKLKYFIKSAMEMSLEMRLIKGEQAKEFIKKNYNSETFNLKWKNTYMNLFNYES